MRERMMMIKYHTFMNNTEQHVNKRQQQQQERHRWGKIDFSLGKTISQIVVLCCIFRWKSHNFFAIHLWMIKFYVSSENIILKVLDKSSCSF